VGWPVIRGVGLALVVLAGAVACTGSGSGDGDSPPSAPAPLSSATAVTTDHALLVDALLNPDEVLSALADEVPAGSDLLIGQTVGQDLTWLEEAQRLCVDPVLIPGWQAGAEFTMSGGGLSTVFVQKLLSADPAVIEEAFHLFRLANEAAPEIAPAASGDIVCRGAPPGYGPAPVGDDAVAWEVEGGPDGDGRAVVIRSGDVLMMIWVLRQVLVPEAADLTREQVDAVAAAAVDKLP
jgi:hypothetical protein